MATTGAAESPHVGRRPLLLAARDLRRHERRRAAHREQGVHSPRAADRVADSGRQPSFLTASLASESPEATSRKREPRQGMECGEYQLFQACLLALGGSPLSFPSQISATSFSYCLVDRDSPSSSTLQFGDSEQPTVTAPLLRSPRTNTFYYVGLSGISVGGQTLSIPSSAFAMDDAGSGGVIVDSGTAVTRLQSGAYGALREAFEQGTQSLPRASGILLFDTCYDLAGRQSVQVPAVALRFEGGGELKLPGRAQPRTCSGRACASASTQPRTPSASPPTSASGRERASLVFKGVFEST
ncbi:hypothetical protein ACQJBY_044707 [Aegilops geniculata]